LNGTLPFAVHEAHEKYGEIVRIAPDELSYIDARAWKDIYGPRPGKQEIPKDPNFYLNTAVGDLSIIGANSERHGKLRRLLSHGFSERALQDQVPIVQGYIDLFIARLRVLSKKSQPVDMVQWYNVRALLCLELREADSLPPSTLPSMSSAIWLLQNHSDVWKRENITHGLISRSRSLLQVHINVPLITGLWWER
jgi:hypothetical protein